MQVSFDLTKEDLIAHNLYRQQRSPSIQRQRRMVSGVFLIGGLALGAVLLTHEHSSASFLAWAMVALLLVTPAILPSSYRRSTIKLVGRLIDEGKNKSLLGRKEITITPVDICGAGELRSMTVRWKAVERIEETSDYLYIYFSSLEAFIIPRRAFAGEADFAAFAAGVRKHWQAAEQAQ